MGYDILHYVPEGSATYISAPYIKQVQIQYTGQCLQYPALQTCIFLMYMLHLQQSDVIIEPTHLHAGLTHAATPNPKTL